MVDVDEILKLIEQFAKAIKFKMVKFLKQLWFRILTFNRNEYVTLSIALSSKSKRSVQWYFQNLFLPLLVIFSPYLLTSVSHSFHKITFNKTLLELGLTGSLTLLGINVMRASLSVVNEKIDESKIPEDIKKNVVDDIESIKAKLRLWIFALTFIGGLLYMVQVGGLIDAATAIAKWYLLGFALISLLSVYISRLIVVIQSNFADNESLIQIWIESLSYNSEQDYSNLKTLIKKDGLL